MAAVLGADLLAGWLGLWPSVERLAQDGFHRAPASDGNSVTAAEMRAALWLDGYAADDDIVATTHHLVEIAPALDDAAVPAQPNHPEGAAGGYPCAQQPPPDPVLADFGTVR